jgi:hydrogenase maturation protease
MPSQTTLFVGLGSAHGDDRAGWLVADSLAPRLGPQAIVRRAVAPLDILDWLEGIERLAVCDACQGIGPLGSWRCWESPLADIPAARARHSHDLGLAAALQVAARLGHLPREVIVWGIEIGQTGPQQLTSREVVAAIPAIADDVVNRLNCPDASLSWGRTAVGRSDI